MTLHDLPFLNACLNGTSAVFLLLGWIAIHRGQRRAHAAFMITALVTSIAFLTSYIIYHLTAKITTFPNLGWIKTAYLILLFTHVVLAVVNLPLIILTIIPAIRERFDKHRRIARWTWPIWMYVSVTGVIVYLMLYQWFPAVKA